MLTISQLQQSYNQHYSHLAKPEHIGFYTLSLDRAIRTAYHYYLYEQQQLTLNEFIDHVPMWRTEMLITSACNFKCSYCRGTTPLFNGGHIEYNHICSAIQYWLNEHVQYIRLSGGEPCLHPDIIRILEYIHTNTCSGTQVAISTNGSLSLSLSTYYEQLSCI